MTEPTDPVLAAIRQLLLAGWPFRLVLSTTAGHVGMIPADLIAAFPETLPLNIDPEKLGGFEFPDERTISMTLAFYGALGAGQVRTLFVTAESIVGIFVPGRVGFGEPKKADPEKPVRTSGLRVVRQAN